MIGGVISAHAPVLFPLPGRAKPPQARTLRLAFVAQCASLAFFLSCPALFSQSHAHVAPQVSNTSRTLLRASEDSNLYPRTPGEDSYSNAAHLYQRGQYQEAANAYQIACDKFNAKACTDLGVMYRRGQGVRRDYPRATKFTLRGCDGGNAQGCTNLGLMYWNNVLPKDDQRAGELFARACDGGDAHGCRALAFLYEQGQGVTKDLARAALFCQKAGEQARQHRIPFQVRDGLILIETKINDEMVKLIVDTGATTALALRFLPPGRPLDLPAQTLDLVHGNMPVYPIRVTWSLDGQNKQVAAITGEFTLPSGTGGIFGADMLETFHSARFDFQNSVLILEDE